jgi:hypothetical protein
MSDQPQTGSEAWPLSLEQRVNDLCNRFEDAWNAGQRPRIEEFLEGLPESGRSRLFRELLSLELAYRRQQGESPTPEDFCQRLQFLATLTSISTVTCSLTWWAASRGESGMAAPSTQCFGKRTVTRSEASSIPWTECGSPVGR